MYNRRIPTDPQERLRQQGGIQHMKSGDIEIRHNEDHVSVRHQGTARPIKVYKPTQVLRGPLVGKPTNYTFYDLLISEEDEEIRKYCFEDWVFPKIMNLNAGTPQQKFCMVPEQTIRRGRLYGNMSQNEVSRPTVTQYIYVILNPGKNPVPSFGTYPGMDFTRMSYLVCAEIGDPRYGNLSNAFIQYALLLNTPIQNCIELVTCTMPMGAERIPTDPGSPNYFYGVKGNPELEQEIFDRWFNSGDYYFNAIIYPTIRNYMTNEE